MYTSELAKHAQRAKAVDYWRKERESATKPIPEKVLDDMRSTLPRSSMAALKACTSIRRGASPRLQQCIDRNWSGGGTLPQESHSSL